MIDLFETLSKNLRPDNQNKPLKEVEKFVSSWRNTDKHPCPECGNKLSNPNYHCDKCNVKIKLKMRF